MEHFKQLRITKSFGDLCLQIDPLFGLMCILLICLLSLPGTASAIEDKNLGELIVFVLNKDKEIIMSSKASVVDRSGIIFMDAKVVRLWLDDVSYDLVAKSPKGEMLPIQKLIALSVRHGKALASLEMRDTSLESSASINPNSPYADFVNSNIRFYKKSLTRQMQEDNKSTINTQTKPLSPSAQPQVSEAPDKDYLKKAGQVMMQSKKLADAETMFKKAYELDPKDAKTMLFLGQIYATTGRLQEAEILYKDAYSITKSKEILKRLGNLFIISGKYEEAIYSLQTFLNYTPHDSGARYSLALAYVIAGNKDKAYQEYIVLNRTDRTKAEELFEIMFR